MDLAGGWFGCCRWRSMAVSAAGCAWLRSPFVIGKPAAPPVLPADPTLEQVIAVVNGNSAKIRSFSTTAATLSGSGVPRSVRASSSSGRDASASLPGTR